MCGAPAQLARIEMLDEAEGNVLVYSRCGRCSVGLLARVTVVPQGMFGAAILTDLEKGEIGKFTESEPITTDEVLDFVRSLR